MPVLKMDGITDGLTDQELIEFTRQAFQQLEATQPHELSASDLRSLETDSDLCDVLLLSDSSSCDPEVQRQCFEELMLGKADDWKIKE